MLLAFILFGALLSSLLAAGVVPVAPALLLAAFALLLARPLAMGLVLLGAGMSRHAKLFIAWFGPRGLSSLLLALLVVIGDVPDAERLLAIVGVVVIASVLLHGVTATPLGAWYGRRLRKGTLPEEQDGVPGDLFHLPMHLLEHAPAAAPRMSVERLAALLESPDKPLVLDVRSRASYEPEDGQIPSSIRVLPDEVPDWITRWEIDHPAEDRRRRVRQVVTYCT